MADPGPTRGSKVRALAVVGALAGCPGDGGDGSDGAGDESGAASGGGSTAMPASTSGEPTGASGVVTSSGAETSSGSTTAGESTGGETETGAETTTTTTGATEETGDASTGEPDDACPSDDLAFAPPAVALPDGTAVAIDVLGLAAVVVIDAATETATAEATLTFRLGSAGGMPIFDLRQSIGAAALDGVAVDPSLMAARDLGGGLGAGMRVLAAPLPGCSEHALALTYDLGLPTSPGAKAMQWEFEAGRVQWDFWFSDLFPGRYLESWFPANLIHDRFPFTLEVSLVNSPVEHRVAANGAVELLGAGHWRVTYPPEYSAFSPMFVLVAEDRVYVDAAVVQLPDATQVTVDVVRELAAAMTFAEVVAETETSFATFVASTGAYLHGDRFLVYGWADDSRSMEYDGATTTILPSLGHELFHSWFGRGVKPASQRDGWIDEAWDMHAVTVGFNETPLDFFADPVELASPNPWSRITPDAAYDAGEAVFAGIAALVGTPALTQAMRGFYEAHALERVTTADLERHLHCTLAAPQVRFVFHRFVYGLAGEPAAAPPDYCD